MYLDRCVTYVPGLYQVCRRWRLTLVEEDGRFVETRFARILFDSPAA